jgi:hypothetical protein
MSKEGARNWYIFDGGRISGPFSSGDVNKQITEGLSADSLVWDGVSSNWVSILAWNLEHLGQFAPYDAWYFSIDGIQQGSFTLKELSDKILNKEVPLHARFWTTGLIKWVTLSELPQVVEGAGLLRRKVPRAPFVGDIEIKGMVVEVPVGATTLSEGGIGLLNLLQLGVGAKISLNIVSQLLSEKIETRATILHQSGNTSSLKFEGLSAKSRQCILNYISRFTSGGEFNKVG